MLLFIATMYHPSSLECGLAFLLSNDCCYYDVCISLCDCAVQEDLLNGKEDDEFIKGLAKRITMPTLILWGDHDRVSATLCRDPHHRKLTSLVS